ncbi:MAG: glycine cleavage system protein H [Blastocatellia bacterium]|nr:glycine cleavage system protein H [Blastocatellia bacterium]MCS7156251.1 glycine cleavage system protein H [Blastocatellia bacterium]MCX7751399.1 glycine cleavage system protein H [Blastocatellia bacterium]MDW8169112.1 glycine cleavage system protein H [Acidobacteriota bacterium]MDW8255816.1 glycine cleavage system protein H [Acidobacteriota bacterium]
MKPEANKWMRKRWAGATGAASPVVFEGEYDSALLKCVWMLAGIVDYKLCDRDYECEQCPFDRAFREQTAGAVAERIARRVPAERIVYDRVEDHGLAGCPLCKEQRDPLHEQSAGRDLTFVREGFHMKEALFYHPAHLWARIERRGNVRIGLDDFGQKLLGRIYQVKLSEVGARVIAGHPCGTLVHQAGEIAVPAPMTGVVRQLNEKLKRYPSLINHDPYGEGWMLILQPERLQEGLRHLLYGEQAFAWYEQEVARLHQEIHAALCTMGTPPEALAGRTLQDGGVPVSPSERDLLAPPAREALIEQLGPTGWAQVIARFLHPQAGRSKSAPERKSRHRR